MADTSKRKRSSKPKSRTGCMACKYVTIGVRHLKCDESKPICLRCAKFGRPCYLLPHGSRAMEKFKEKVLLPKTVANFATQPSLALSFESEIEFRFFRVFQDKTAAELSAYFDCNIWNRSLLQVCHEERFAVHAVIAIGALHEAMETVQSSQKPSLPLEVRAELGLQHHHFALQQYGKALKFMKELPGRKENSSVRNTLFSCLLTTCFEMYIGNEDNALGQAQTGINLLNENGMAYESWTPDDLTSLLSVISCEDQDFIGTFARLETSLAMFNANLQVPRRLMPLREEESAAFKQMPEKFDSVREARFCWDLSVRRALQWRQVHLQQSGFSTLNFGEDIITSNVRKADKSAQRLETELELYEKAKSQWGQAFQPLFERTRKHPGSKEFLGASILMIQYLSSGMVTALMGQVYETESDAFLDDHIRTVDLARDVLEACPWRTPRQAVFVFDDGLVAGIFYVATRCRNKPIRRQAIRLLQRYPRREGLWDSSMAVKVSTWVMDKEEEGLVDGYVPETARLRIVKLDLRLSERTVVLRYSRFMDGCEERIELPDMVLKW